MTRLSWDEVGDKRYESSVDRGVLYLPDGRGVPWNGLTSVEENLSSAATTAYYYDGIKYLDTRYPGEFEATLSAYTYPDEFLQFDGYAELETGVLLGQQPVYERFGLSYRTKIGDDLTEDAGYKIHVLYNLVATPSNRKYQTSSDSPEALDFGWTISGVPERIAGHRPTVHIVVDTTKINSFMVRDIEDLLYGATPSFEPAVVYDGGTSTSSTGTLIDGGSSADGGFGIYDGGTSSSAEKAVGSVTSTVATLPKLQDFVELLNSWTLIEITDNGDGTWTAAGPSEFIEMLDADTFQITGNARMIDADTYEISTTHGL